MGDLIGISPEDFGSDNKKIERKLKPADKNPHAKPYLINEKIGYSCFQSHKHCPICECSGLLMQQTENYQSTKWESCICQDKSISLKDTYKRGWSSIDFVETFENYEDKSRPGIKAKQQVLKWIKNIDNPDSATHIFLIGSNGTGKSHLAKACVNHFSEINQIGQYILYPEFSLIVEDFGENSNRINQLKSIVEQPILIFDEMYFGYERSKYKSSKFDEILLTRWEYKRPTLITGNVELKQLSDPIKSRFSDKKLTVVVDLWNEQDQRLL